jgi:hypothetical protein
MVGAAVGIAVAVIDRLLHSVLASIGYVPIVGWLFWLAQLAAQDLSNARAPAANADRGANSGG